MSRVHLRVALRGEDLAAISALDVLRTQLGAEDLASLSRETVWEIDLAETADRNALERAARESLLFANPVKERWRIEEGLLTLGSAPGRRAVGLLVRDRGDHAGDARAAALRETWGLATARVTRATLWILDLPDHGRDAALERARELGITTGRRSGLLVNPQYQDVEFVTGV
jgi:hypothetical protein